MHLTSGTSLQNGKYRIIRLLGQGGFGLTYLAEHTMLDKKIAIKEFFPKEYCDRDATSHITIGTQNNIELVAQLKNKFIKEARNISRLHHPNIITIHDVFQENDTAYYVMEFVDGASLSEIVKQHGAMSESEAVRYILKIAEAVGYMHSLSMNHLDLKPANIMVRQSDGEPILIDFGLSKQYNASGDQTSTTPVGISHGFAPIEQYRPGGVATFTPQTDVYALGATFYNLLTGMVPPHYSDILEDGLPEFPQSISKEVAKVVEHAMEIKKNKRPATIDAFVSELSGYAVCESSTSDIKENTTQGVQVLKVTPVYKYSKATPEKNEECKEKKEIEADDSGIAIEDSTVILPTASENIPTCSVETSNLEKKDEICIELPNSFIGGIEFVDLGLSVKWATMNVEAESPTDAGIFIDTENNENIEIIIQYCEQGASVPTKAQFEELRNNCTWEWTEFRSHGGYMVHGKNGNSIFLPFTSEGSDISFCTSGKLYTKEAFNERNSTLKRSFFYFSHGDTYRVRSSKERQCPVRLVLES